MKKRINICFASDANYAKYMGIAISSILRHKNEEDDIHIYVLDGGILQEDKNKIKSLEKTFSSYKKFRCFKAEFFSFTTEGY